MTTPFAALHESADGTKLTFLLTLDSRGDKADLVL